MTGRRWSRWSWAPGAITEAGGESMVTARLDRPSSAETVVTVSAAPVSPAVAGDYTLGAKLELTVAAGETESTGEGDDHGPWTMKWTRRTSR